jgi:hypothetical protein
MSITYVEENEFKSKYHEVVEGKHLTGVLSMMMIHVANLQKLLSEEIRMKNMDICDEDDIPF